MLSVIVLLCYSILLFFVAVVIVFYDLEKFSSLCLQRIYGENYFGDLQSVTFPGCYKSQLRIWTCFEKLQVFLKTSILRIYKELKHYSGRLDPDKATSLYMLSLHYHTRDLLLIKIDVVHTPGTFT